MSSVHEIVAASGVTQQKVREVTAFFYARVRIDPILGPVFNSVIAEEDWPAHIEKVSRFWDLAFRLDRNYAAGGFMAAHLKHAHIQQEHTHRWLQLFEEALADVCNAREAAGFRAVANAMMENVRFGLRRRDKILANAAAS